MKLLIVRSAEESPWGSCKVISPNLQAIYQNLPPKDFQISWFEFPLEYLQEEVQSKESIVQNFLNVIKVEKPDQLIFVDHLPIPPQILLVLSLLCPLTTLPPITFHVYGDFTYFAIHWMRISELLEGHPVKFIVASSAQERLVKFFLNKGNGVESFLFPINSEDFYFDEKERAAARQKYQISADEKVLLYSGRISLQKNVDLLISEFVALSKTTKEKIHLWIVGGFDDIGVEFMGVQTYPGYLFQKIQSQLDLYPKEIADRIRFFGHQNKTVLRQLKAASDGAVSMAIYHDEDFGMSPAEGLAVGLPTLLTEWGGFSSFVSSDGSWKCDLMPVAITKYGHEIETGLLETFYKNLSAENEMRKKYSENFLKKFSISNNHSRLIDIIKKPFEKFGGFSWKLEQYAHNYWSFKRGKELNKFLNPVDNKFYEEVYSNYLGKRK